MMNLLKIETVRYQDRMATIKQIRTKVFQEEQGVSPELEFDGLDEGAIHLLAYLSNKPIGTARIREIDAVTDKIERLAVLPEARKQSVGRRLMERALAIISQRNKTSAIVHAQEYIARLYQKLGFEAVGGKFDEAGIAHVKMIVQLSSNK